jgi:hypothetical protein
MNIVKSARAYDRWLRAQLDGDIVKDDLEEKRAKMAADPFQFLRATYWRWAENVLEICPDLKRAPQVLAVGDIHIENFGTWRDSEGRLVWGVNDYDEAARMPYALDLVRLATSAVLAQVPGMSLPAICANILKGYREGIDDPWPYVLDRKHRWLRDIVVVSDEDRKHFWKKLDPKKDKEKGAKSGAKKIKPRYVAVLKSARPDPLIVLKYSARTAGTGSLGRPRWFGIGEWHGDKIVREAKAIVRSGWIRAHRGSRRLRCEEIATGKHRCPDPWYRLRGRVLVRRLSPNDYKIEAQPKKKSETKYNAVRRSQLVNGRMLHAMGRDLAAIHRGTPNRRSAIKADLDNRGPGWLRTAVAAATESVRSEWQEWQAHHASG